MPSTTPVPEPVASSVEAQLVEDPAVAGADEDVLAGGGAVGVAAGDVDAPRERGRAVHGEDDEVVGGVLLREVHDRGGLRGGGPRGDRGGGGELERRQRAAGDGAEGAALGLVDDEVAADHGQAAVGPVEADVAGAVGVQDGVPDDQALAGADAGVVLGVGAGRGDRSQRCGRRGWRGLPGRCLPWRPGLRRRSRGRGQKPGWASCTIS